MNKHVCRTIYQHRKFQAIFKTFESAINLKKIDLILYSIRRPFFNTTISAITSFETIKAPTSFPGFPPTSPYGAMLRSERERHPGWVFSRGPRTKLIPRKESFVSQFFCLVHFHRSRNNRKGKTDLLSLQL